MNNQVSKFFLKGLSLAIISCWALQSAFADWVYISIEQMRSYAKVIAVVSIAKVEKIPRGERGQSGFGQKAQVAVETLVKGDLAKQFTLYGGINCDGFTRCVPDVTLEPGRFLVFLNQNQGVWSVVNAERGYRRITGDSVAWWQNADANKEQQCKLADVIRQMSGKDPSVNKSSEAESTDESQVRPPVSRQDLEIIRRAQKILNSPEKWNRKDTRVCSPGDKKFSLYCALEMATRQVTGKFEHRSALLQETRFVIDELIPKNGYEHRLMGYNNDPRTSFADVQKLMVLVEKRVSQRLASKK